MSEPTAFAVAKTAYRVPVDLIDPEGGLRPLDLQWVAGLQGLFTHDGQDDPIEIFRKPDGRYGVTKGCHRLAAATGLEWATIDAFIDLESRRREVSENLCRLNLDPIARADFVAELIQIEKARAGLDEAANVKSVLATARWADRIGAEADDASVTMTLAFGFSEQVAEKVGLSRKTIYRALEIHRGLKPDVAAALRGLPVAQNASQLRALARLPEGEQRAVAELLTQGTAKGVTDALATMRQRPVKSPEQKHWNAFLGAWTRMSRKTRKLALIGILEHVSTEREFKVLRAALTLEGDDATALDILLSRPGSELVVESLAVDGPVSGRRGPSQGVRPVRDGGGARDVAPADGGDHGGGISAGDAEEALADRATATSTFGVAA